jgi:hypothetical protein
MEVHVINLIFNTTFLNNFLIDFFYVFLTPNVVKTLQFFEETTIAVLIVTVFTVFHSRLLIFNRVILFCASLSMDV